MEISDIPHLNAALNAATVVLLAKGYYHIRKGDKQRHRAAMLGALVVSALFLVGYVIYKANAGFAKFGGEGVIRPIYFTILIVHVVGAFSIVPLVPWTVWRAIKGNFEGHKKLARITWPVWFFVGVSGVVVYVMAIHLYPYTGG